jgi:hypothetical protein
VGSSRTGPDRRACAPLCLCCVVCLCVCVCLVVAERAPMDLKAARAQVAMVGTLSPKTLRMMRQQKLAGARAGAGAAEQLSPSGHAQPNAPAPAPAPTLRMPSVFFGAGMAMGAISEDEDKPQQQPQQQPPPSPSPAVGTEAPSPGPAPPKRLSALVSAGYRRCLGGTHTRVGECVPGGRGCGRHAGGSCGAVGVSGEASGGIVSPSAG